MHLNIKLLLLFLSMTFISTKQNEPIKKAVIEEIHSIDLQELNSKKALPETKVIASENDPVYHKTKRFNAFALKPFLDNYWHFDKLKNTDWKIVFECEDGYKPEMTLEKFLSVNSFLAVSDVDAPEGQSWEKLLKNGNEMIIEPFLLFYDKAVSPDDKNFKRPYNLTKIHLQPTQTDELSVPTEIAAISGYKLYTTHCKTCHAINGIGGTMGPELNYPKSVTEYWKTGELTKYIVNPSAFRYKVKMPSPGISTEQSKEIVTYLSYMAGKKEKP